MTGRETGQWPSELNGIQRLHTIKKTRDNARDSMLRRIPLDNPFEVTPVLERTLYSGIGRITRLPQEGVDYVLQAIIVLRDVSMYLAMNKALAELKVEAKGMQEVSRSVMDANAGSQKRYKNQMRGAIDEALRRVVGNPETYTSEKIRGVMQECLEIRGRPRRTA